jgi:hypothetical protein
VPTRSPRADEIAHSGVIDQRMFEMLLRADLVVADISTANPNALYELGVRHALRPLSTIIIKEQDGKFLFDLSHLATLRYKHLGEDIGAREAEAKRNELQELIVQVRTRKEPDSPVYTFLRELQEPVMSDEDFVAAVEGAKAGTDTLARILEDARRADRETRHADARDAFQRAYDYYLGLHGDPAKMDPFILQQLAIHTYKCEQPSRVDALHRAWDILAPIRPELSTDPETLTIAGAIQRKLWRELQELPCLELAIELYGRGFHIRGDYTNGEKYAMCLDMRAAAQGDPAEAAYDRMAARKARARTVAGLRRALDESTPDDRSDYKRMLATMANALYALGDPAAAEYEARFRACGLLAWEVQTFEHDKAAAIALTDRGMLGAL